MHHGKYLLPSEASEAKACFRFRASAGNKGFNTSQLGSLLRNGSSGLALRFNTLYNSLINKCRKNSWLNQRPWIKQFIKFSIAGGVCTILDFLIYVVLTRFFPFWASHLAWANFLSVCLAATVNFVWNKNWTFRSYQSNTIAQYLKFWVVVLGGLVLYQALFFLLVGRLGFFDLLGKAIAAAIVWVVRFILNKFWSFK